MVAAGDGIVGRVDDGLSPDGNVNFRPVHGVGSDEARWHDSDNGEGFVGDGECTTNDSRIAVEPGFPVAVTDYGYGCLSFAVIQR